MHGRNCDPLLRPDEEEIPYRTWDTYDPRVEEFFSERNRYLTGPGAYLPPEHQPFRAYNFRGHNMPVRLCIRGIHPHTTEDGIGHILSNYGHPISIERKRNRFNEVIAFAEYHTQREADNAIIALDGKPPLNWRVTYAYTRFEESFVSNLADLNLSAEIESQQPLFQGPAIPARTLPPAGGQSGAIALPATAQASNFPPCVVCGSSAGTVCTICNTRYCSERCQRVDWPSHQKVCIPPPPLKPAGPVESRSKPSSNVTQTNASVPFVHKPALPAPVIAQPAKETNEAHAFVIKGITPLDKVQPKPSVEAPVKIQRASPPNGAFSLNLSESQKPSSAVPSSAIQKAPQPPRVSLLASQTSPLQSTNSSINPSPIREARYAKSYAKTSSPFSGNEPKHRVCVCFVKSPEEFFVHHAKHRNSLLEITQELQNTAYTCDPIADPVLGSPCAALYQEDGVWYRAQILKVFPNNEIGVRFVDYGNTAKMANSPDNFRLLELKFARHPGFAVKVKLADVLPPNGTTWDSYVRTAFTQLIENKEFHLEVVRADEDQIIVRLKNEAGQDLGSELVKRGLAKTVARDGISNQLDPRSTPPKVVSQVPPPPQVGQKPLVTNASPMDRRPFPNQSTPPAQQKPSPKPSPIPTPLQQANTNSPQAVTPPAQVPRMPVKMPMKKSSPVHQFVKKSTYSILSKMTVNTEAKFMVTELNGNEIAGTLANERFVQALDFHAVAENSPTSANFNPPLKTVVAAFSQQFQNWFRGYVLAKKGALHDVLFVDYGTVERGIQKVKPLPPKYDPPELGVKLTLTGNVSAAFLKENMLVESTHRVVITAAGDEECTVSFVEEDNVQGKLVPWMQLVPREIPSAHWEVGLNAEVMVILAEDVDRLYVQLVADETIENTSAIEQKMAMMLESFEAIPPLKSMPKVGSYVAAIFPDDGALYRARVVSTDNDVVTVEYVDWGNSASVGLDLVRPLPDELYAHPICGRFVSLSQIERPIGELPDDVKAVLAETVNSVCTMTIAAIDEKIEVVLNKDGCVINERIGDLLQSALASMPALAPAAEEKPAVDYTLGEFGYADGPFVEIAEGSTLDVLVLENEDPRLLMFCPGDEDKLRKLNELQVEIQTYADTIIRGFSPQPGAVCLGRTPDGTWYRVACLEQMKEGDSTLHFCIQVDYGKMSLYDTLDLRRIPQRFVHALPYLAFQGILNELKSYDEPDEALKKRLRELLPVRSVVQLTIVRLDGESYIVDIPGVGDQLVKEGLL